MLHIHGAYPFLYVRLPEEEKYAQKYAEGLQVLTNTALGNAFNRPTTYSSDDSPYVKAIKPCKAFDMYGYSVGWSCFLKIWLFNPNHTYKCADLLLSGTVTGEPLQPYESHIPYLLSFLADYNLYGCGWLEFEEENSKERTSSSKTVYRGREIDIEVTSILNKQQVEHKNRHSQVFENENDAISIYSLSEVRDQDSSWRIKSNIRPWQSQNLQPYYQKLVHDWPWERKQEIQQLLAQRIESNKEHGPSLDSQSRWTHLPAAAELVPSKQMANLTVDSSIHSEEELVYSHGEAHSKQEWKGSDGGGTYEITEFNEKLGSKRLLDSESISATALPLRKVEKVAAETENVAPRSLKSDSELFALFDQLSQSDTSVSQIVTQSEQLSQDTMIDYTIGFEAISSQCFQFKYLSPTTEDIRKTFGIAASTPLHFSVPEDVYDKPFIYGGVEHTVKTLAPDALEPFEMTSDGAFPPILAHLLSENDNLKSKAKSMRLELLLIAPSSDEVAEWVAEKARSELLKREQLTLTSATSSNPSEKFQFVSLEPREENVDELVSCVIELHCCTRPGMVPKPSEDPIDAVFWQLSKNNNKGVATKGAISTYPLDFAADIPSVVIVESELHLLLEVIKMIRFFNPDILTGYEINASSWGYARKRYQRLNKEHRDNFFNELGRVKTPALTGWRNFAPGLSNNDSDAVKGRHLLSLWDILRKEVTLSKYNLEYVVYHTLHEKTPHFTYDDLTAWWTTHEPAAMESVVKYWMRRVSYVLRLFAHFETVNHICERSRIIGVDFLSSLTRGSQFQVEAVMCRLARRDNYVLISPSKTEVGRQNALEYIPLVMEPKSEFYTDPVCVLDFRSLYPSIVIALNLCYSTSIGRVDSWRGKNKLGVKQDHVLQKGILAQVGDDNIYVAPNGIGYVNPKVRKSLIAQMLGEILDTRFMINETRKESGSANARFERNMNGKQLALKFIANVTYGYTSASFSGRMPCAELADSIVLAGREILQWCISTIESTTKWNIKPEVVYGDTDSLFVRLPGVSRSQGFSIGREISAMVTALTPDPITLKLEKVYDPCILLTKKRYVGNAYDSEQQLESRFDAKGIETIRRDGTPIVQKIEKRCLQIIFDTHDLSKVKSYLYAQWRGIHNGRNLQIKDFCFAQEVKLGHYKTSKGLSNLPGGAIVSLKKMLKDDGTEPQYRERVPFVIVAGPSGSRINDRVVSPEEMMETPGLVIDAEYYIQKTIIPPLERLFNIMGANIRDWYAKMPRTMRVNSATLHRPPGASGTLQGFLRIETCAACLDNRRLSPSDPLCGDCSQQPKSRYIMTSRVRLQEAQLASTLRDCHICAGQVPESKKSRTFPCQSIDCSVFYEREAAFNELELESKVLDLLLP